MILPATDLEEPMDLVIAIDSRTLLCLGLGCLLLVWKYPRKAAAVALLVVISEGQALTTRSMTSYLLREGFKVIARGGTGSHVKLRRDKLVIQLPGNREHLSHPVMHIVARKLGIDVHELARRASH